MPPRLVTCTLCVRHGLCAGQLLFNQGAAVAAGFFGGVDCGMKVGFRRSLGVNDNGVDLHLIAIGFNPMAAPGKPAQQVSK